MSNDPANPLNSPTVQATLEPSTAKLGDVLTLDIQIMHPAALTIQPIVLPKTLGTYEVVISSQWPTKVSGPDLVEHFTAQLQNFATGPQLLPSFEIRYQDLQQKPQVLKTTPLTTTVRLVPPGPKDKGGDIRGIIGVIGPVAWSPWWWMLLGIAVIAAGAYAFARRKKIILGPPPPPPVPADQTALKKLFELAESGWIESGKWKEFYSVISDTLRAYLEGGFDIAALERTTNELMRDLRKRGAFNPSLQTDLKELLETCDLVKFAKLRPTVEEAQKDHKTAVEFVEKTRDALRRP